MNRNSTLDALKHGVSVAVKRGEVEAVTAHTPTEWVHDFTGGPGRDIPMRMVVYTKDDRVAFYDRRYSFTPDGQHISSYDSQTLLIAGWSQGINLAGGIPNWIIGPREYLEPFKFLKNICGAT